jgi:hypothetical protein
MKSDARLGDNDPTTSTPSTTVCSTVCALMPVSLGEATDSPAVPDPIRWST